MFAGAVVQLDDQLANDADAAVKKPFLVCNPTDAGSGIQNPVDHLVCYKLDADRLDPPVRVEVVNPLGLVRLELRTPKFLCVHPSKEALP